MVFFLPRDFPLSPQLSRPFKRNEIDPFAQGCIHDFSPELLQLPHNILVGIRMGAQIDFADNTDAGARRLPRIDKGAGRCDNVFEQSIQFMEIEAGRRFLQSAKPCPAEPFP